ncbi:uncharacterized protein LOC130759615 isoform X2 [Actinidia eriantha]|uniref:uncharacterized protein LOC130759615 isoform X2 n=1 Tax=Actinidia eriantha TaxID=165200 RepID=UPI00258D1105|nr:uncharacterized protein LOC130759615 isoform X2 [Actinidia eriantha]XP_057470760.1 uncharacterized protein LOC130759615 isoform X2 [Actinidia eriantha]
MFSSILKPEPNPNFTRTCNLTGKRPRTIPRPRSHLSRARERSFRRSFMALKISLKRSRKLQPEERIFSLSSVTSHAAEEQGVGRNDGKADIGQGQSKDRVLVTYGRSEWEGMDKLRKVLHH